MVVLPSVCPHDCPGACALEVEVEDGARVRRVRGAKSMPYTDGIICAKVSRYEERVHHPERVLRPLLRDGPKGSGRFRPVEWAEALDRVAEGFQAAAERHGPETVWPYWYAGTMGLVQRDGLVRLTRCLGYSQLQTTICSSIGKAGLMAGLGASVGTDARELPEAELIIVWGMNPIYTQVNVWAWIKKARDRGARLVVIDPHRTATAEKADWHFAPAPGTDDALACSVMQVILSEGLADRTFLAERTDFSADIESELSECTPEWAAEITGIPAESIRQLARLYASTKKSYIRVGYGFTRSRNGAHRLHVVSCLPSMTGAWRERGGGFLAASGGAFHVDKTLIEGTDVPTSARRLDMSQIGRVLTGDDEALRRGPPVTAMIVQNSNPAVVAPEQNLVLEGLAREDLFLCVHEQFMTDTAKFADVVLPATTFLEHADVYTSYGHTFLQVAKPVLPPSGEAKSNHEVLQGLAERLGASHQAFGMDTWTLIDETLRASGYPSADEVLAERWVDVADDARNVPLREQFPAPDGRFRFRPQWPEGQAGSMPKGLGHWATNDTRFPLRLIPGPARHFLNSTFTETASSQAKQVRPTVLVHPEDAETRGVGSGDEVWLENELGQVCLHAEVSTDTKRGVIIVESVWPRGAFLAGEGINVLTSADAVAPAGGAAFHDTSVELRRA